jgi:hypothetical protein
MLLGKTSKTLFEWNNEKYNVREAPAHVFDQWIHEYVEEIVGVDVSIWDIYDRWQIINTLLDGGYLDMEVTEGGYWLLKTPPHGIEESI